MRPKNTSPADPFNDGTHPLTDAAPRKTLPPLFAATNENVAPQNVESIAPQDIKSHRLAGIGLTLLGSAMSYFTIYRPLDAAAHNVANLSYSMKLTAITPFLLLYGVSLCCFQSLC